MLVIERKTGWRVGGKFAQRPPWDKADKMTPALVCEGRPVGAVGGQGAGFNRVAGC